MKHIKRSKIHKQTLADELKILENQINQAWKEREQQEQEKMVRIKKEIDCAWAEYDAKNNSDDFDKEDYTIEVEEYFLNAEDNDETYKSEVYEEGETELRGHLYSKNKMRSARRRATVRAKKRLIKKAIISKLNLRKRKKDEWINQMKHPNEGFKSRVVRCNALQKKAKRLQR